MVRFVNSEASLIQVQDFNHETFDQTGYTPYDAFFWILQKYFESMVFIAITIDSFCLNHPTMAAFIGYTICIITIVHTFRNFKKVVQQTFKMSVYSTAAVLVITSLLWISLSGFESFLDDVQTLWGAFIRKDSFAIEALHNMVFQLVMVLGPSNFL